jgi:hypothetical protein
VSGDEPGKARMTPGIRARVVVASNRAATGVYADTSGPLLVAGLRELGCEVPDPVVVPDGDPVARALREAVADGVDVVLTSGGTGITPTDRTPKRSAGTAWRRCRPPRCPGRWPAWPDVPSSSTCPARRVARRTASPCSARSSGTRSISCVAATIPGPARLAG